MELVFDVVSAQQRLPGLLTSKRFTQAGGVIGRADYCDWTIPDPSRVLSGRHAEVRYHEGRYYLTDTSRNGISRQPSGERLAKGQPHAIAHGDGFRLGDYEIVARLLVAPEALEVGRPVDGDTLIPDDAFLDLDPLVAIDGPDPLLDDDLSLLTPRTEETSQQDYARVETESLMVPELVPARQAEQPAVAARQQVPAEFWARFGKALGVDLASLDEEAREALALRGARLLGQCIDGLQQGLRTRAELKNEMRLAQTSVQGAGHNPLKHSSDPHEALRRLLVDHRAGQLSAEQAVTRAFRDLQAHQVALVAANRAALRGMLEQLSPDQLCVRFEREGKRGWSTDGGRWRAYRRWHDAMRRDERWGEHLLAREFTQTYEEQSRLIATLDTPTQG